MTKTTDPEVGRELGIGKKPTTHCQECGEGWWDDDLHARVMEAETVLAVNETVEGEECPHCGHIQEAL